MIIKIQRPLAGTPNVLIYDRTRKYQRLEKFTKKWRSYFKSFGNPLKIYAKCHIEGTILCIDYVVKDKNW